MGNSTFHATFAANINRRRALKMPGYKTLAECGYDGEYVTPYQIASRSEAGPVMVAYHWFDAPSAMENHALLSRTGFMPGIPFNQVLDLALQFSRRSRADIYMTQAFHLLPERRSQTIRAGDIDVSFDLVTRHELHERGVIALGGPASKVCFRHGIKHTAVCHPSARGRTYDDKAREIASVLLKF